MALEIERKFLVSGNFKKDTYLAERIVQGYLSSVPERTVRVRIRGERGYLTVKGASNKAGLSRFEFEKEISLEDAEQLIQLCEPGVIDKVRYEAKVGMHTFEIDEFHGDNEGLVMAEVELQNENDSIEIPVWLGKEVTGDVRYYNAMLSKNPYKNWK